MFSILKEVRAVRVDAGIHEREFLRRGERAFWAPAVLPIIPSPPVIRMRFR